MRALYWILFSAALAVLPCAASAEDFASIDGGLCESVSPSQFGATVCTLTTGANEATNTIDVRRCKRFTFVLFGSVSGNVETCDSDAGTSCDALNSTTLSGGSSAFAWGTSDPFRFVRFNVTANGGTVDFICGG